MNEQHSSGSQTALLDRPPRTPRAAAAAPNCSVPQPPLRNPTRHTTAVLLLACASSQRDTELTKGRTEGRKEWRQTAAGKTVGKTRPSPSNTANIHIHDDYTYIIQFSTDLRLSYLDLVPSKSGWLSVVDEYDWLAWTLCDQY